MQPRQFSAILIRSKQIDNSRAVRKDIDEAITRALEVIGGTAETYAKKLCPVGTPESTGIKGYRGGTLRNSITHQVTDKTVSVGSNVHYAPYVELGTGAQYEQPPAWMQNNAKRGSHTLPHGMAPRPYLRPAMEDHKEEYAAIFKDEFSNLA